VDHQARGLAILRQNLELLGLKERARVFRGDVVRWLETSPDQVKRAGLVFLDPPYDDVVLDRALHVLDRSAEDVTVVAEHSRRHQMPALVRLQVDRERRYGDTIVTVLRA
jgi:16S rRNA G966 N2-methylase RsmD